MGEQVHSNLDYKLAVPFLYEFALKKNEVILLGMFNFNFNFKFSRIFSSFSDRRDGHFDQPLQLIPSTKEGNAKREFGKVLALLNAYTLGLCLAGSQSA